MKTKYILLVFTIILGLTSCRQNKLKTDEQALSQQILTEEEQRAQEAARREEKEKRLADSIARLPKGFRFIEDRSVDPEYPPIVIDFTQELKFKEFKLSEIAKEIRYKKLSVPDDSLYFAPHMGGEVSFTDNNIILSNNIGVHSFTLDGDYIEPIANSNLKNLMFNNSSAVVDFNKSNYIGVWSNHVSVAGDRIFYKVSDYPNEKVSLMNYKTNSGNQELKLNDNSEVQGDGSFFKGNIITSGKEGIYSGSPGLSSTQILGISSNFYAGTGSHLDASEKGYMLVTFNLNGDTLCKFSQYDKLENPITSTVIRSISSIITWNYRGVFTFLKSFSDTVFRLIPPNRLVPAYVFNLGSFKITDEDWYQTGKGLINKYLVTSILENDRFLFIGYRYYNEKGEKESRKALFNKQTKELTHLSMVEVDPENSSSIAPRPPAQTSTSIENDIDFGLPFWPDYLTAQGELGMTITPEWLKGHVENMDESLTNDETIKLKEFTKTLRSNENERIIMLVK